MAMHLYDDKFFDWVDSGALRSARRIVPVIMKAVRVTSVLDVGCGRGTWLAAWRERRGHDLPGGDGAPVDPGRLPLPPAGVLATGPARARPPPRPVVPPQTPPGGEHPP